MMNKKIYLLLYFYLIAACSHNLMAQNATEEAMQRFNTLGIVSTVIVIALWGLVWWRRKKRNKSS